MTDDAEYIVIAARGLRRTQGKSESLLLMPCIPSERFPSFGTYDYHAMFDGSAIDLVDDCYILSIVSWEVLLCKCKNWLEARWNCAVDVSSQVHKFARVIMVIFGRRIGPIRGGGHLVLHDLIEF